MDPFGGGALTTTDAGVFDWLSAAAGLDVILGVVGSASGGEGSGVAALRLSVTSALCELAAVDTSGLLAIVLRGPATLEELDYLQRELGFGDILPPSVAMSSAPMLMRAFVRRIEVFPRASSAPGVDVLLLVPRHAISEDAAWVWLLRRVAGRVCPRFVVVMQTGAALASRGLSRLYTAALRAPRVGAAVGSFVSSLSDSPSLHPYAAVAAAAAAGSESADGLSAAIAFPAHPAPQCVALLRWSALSPPCDYVAGTPLGRALGSANRRTGTPALPVLLRLLFEIACQSDSAWEVPLINGVGDLSISASPRLGHSTGAFLARQVRTSHEQGARHRRAALLLPMALGCGRVTHHGASWRVGAAAQGSHAALSVLISALAPALAPLALLVAHADVCAMFTLPAAIAVLPAGPFEWQRGSAASWVLLCVPGTHLAILMVLAIASASCRPRWATPGAAALRGSFVLLASTYSLLTACVLVALVVAAATALVPGAAPVSPVGWKSNESAPLLLAAATLPGLAVCAFLLVSCAGLWRRGGGAAWVTPLLALEAAVLAPAITLWAAAAGSHSADSGIKQMEKLDAAVLLLHDDACAEIAGLSAAASLELLESWREAVDAGESAAAVARTVIEPMPLKRLDSGRAGRRHRDSIKSERRRSAATAAQQSWRQTQDSIAAGFLHDSCAFVPPLQLVPQPATAPPATEPGAANPFLNLVRSAQPASAILGVMSLGGSDDEAAAACDPLALRPELLSSRKFAAALSRQADAAAGVDNAATDEHPARDGILSIAPVAWHAVIDAGRVAALRASRALDELSEPLDIRRGLAPRDVPLNRLASRQHIIRVIDVMASSPTSRRSPISSPAPAFPCYPRLPAVRLGPQSPSTREQVRRALPSRMTLMPEHAVLLARIRAPGVAPTATESLMLFAHDCSTAERRISIDVERASLVGVRGASAHEATENQRQAGEEYPDSATCHLTAQPAVRLGALLAFNALFAGAVIWTDPSLRWVAALGGGTALCLIAHDVACIAVAAATGLFARLQRSVPDHVIASTSVQQTAIPVLRANDVTAPSLYGRRSPFFPAPPLPSARDQRSPYVTNGGPPVSEGRSPTRSCQLGQGRSTQTSTPSFLHVDTSDHAQPPCNFPQAQEALAGHSTCRSLGVASSQSSSLNQVPLATTPSSRMATSHSSATASSPREAKAAHATRIISPLATDSRGVPLSRTSSPRNLRPTPTLTGPSKVTPPCTPPSSGSRVGIAHDVASAPPSPARSSNVFSCGGEKPMASIDATASIHTAVMSGELGSAEAQAVEPDSQPQPGGSQIPAAANREGEMGSNSAAAALSSHSEEEAAGITDFSLRPLNAPVTLFRATSSDSGSTPAGPLRSSQTSSTAEKVCPGSSTTAGEGGSSPPLHSLSFLRSAIALYTPRHPAPPTGVDNAATDEHTSAHSDAAPAQGGAPLTHLPTPLRASGEADPPLIGLHCDTGLHAIRSPAHHAPEPDPPVSASEQKEEGEAAPSRASCDSSIWDRSSRSPSEQGSPPGAPPSSQPHAATSGGMHVGRAGKTTAAMFRAERELVVAAAVAASARGALSLGRT